MTEPSVASSGRLVAATLQAGDHCGTRSKGQLPVKRGPPVFWSKGTKPLAQTNIDLKEICRQRGRKADHFVTPKGAYRCW